MALIMDKIFKEVISNSELSLKYNYNPDDFDNCRNSTSADNAVVAAVAMIVEGISNKQSERDLYTKVVNHLKNNLGNVNKED